MGKTPQNKVSQTASVLAIATVFIGLRTLISTFDNQRRLPMQEFEPIVQGANIREGA